MADFPIRMAAALASPLLGPLGPLTSLAAPAIAEYAGTKFGTDKDKPKPDASKVSDAKDAARVGTVTMILNGKPDKVYAGKDFGEQSYDTYLALRAQDPTRFPAVKGLADTPKAPGLPAPDWSGGGPTATLPDTTSDWGTAGEVTAGNVGTQMQAPTTEPVYEKLLKIFEESQKPGYRKQSTDEAIRQFAATSEISSRLGEVKSAERFRREKELETIRSWTNLQNTAMTTNMLREAMLGQALIASQQPSAAVADVIGKGMQTAQQALSSLNLKA